MSRSMPTTFVLAIMPRRRYEKLSQYVHVSVAADADRTDTLTKVRPFINFAADYSSSRDVAVDEAMIEFDGRIGWKQYMPKKLFKWGIKLWCMCESNSGFCLGFDMYTGEDKDAPAATMTHDLGYRVVMKLMQKL